jgi:hypothetical protein
MTATMFVAVTQEMVVKRPSYGVHHALVQVASVLSTNTYNVTVASQNGERLRSTSYTDNETPTADENTDVDKRVEYFSLLIRAYRQESSIQDMVKTSVRM